MARPLADTFKRLRRTIARGDKVDLLDPDLPPADWAWLATQLDRALTSRDTAVRKLATQTLADAYPRLSSDGRRRFIRNVAADFGVDLAAARDAATGLDSTVASQVALREAMTPRFARMLHLITALDGGVKQLVDLRADVRYLLRGDDSVALLLHELTGHLKTLFDVGLLDLHRITWDSPAALLEKLIEYEAVHEIDGWDDLRNRLEADRRCFAFMHPAMPSEPVVFVEIALQQGPAREIAPLLDTAAPVGDPTEADTAIFYSITSCQKGLAGINLGNELIKGVVGRLRQELPNIEQFMTLSPIPSLRDALTPTLGSHIVALVATDDWLDDPAVAETVKEAVLPAAARYLTTRVDGRAPDPVGNFHLSNGALVEAVRWNANPTPAGMGRSWGVMVNYRYDPARISANAEAYADGAPIPMSDAVRKLVTP